MNKLQMIVINGTGGAGKDTFVTLFTLFAKQRCTAHKVYYVKNYSFVEPVKKIVEKTLVTSEELQEYRNKTEKMRKFMSDMTDIICNNTEYLYECVDKEVEEAKKFLKDRGKSGLTNYTYFLFVHARDPKDIKRFVKKYKAKTLLIKNNNVPIIESNHADREVENFRYDNVISNNKGKMELRPKIEKYLKNIIEDMKNDTETNK